jgi:3-dehydroquinate dehydratase/shikimate dehydrogenase
MAATFVVVGPGRLGQAMGEALGAGRPAPARLRRQGRAQAAAAAEFAGAGAAVRPTSPRRRPATVVLLAVRDGEVAGVVREAAVRAGAAAGAASGCTRADATGLEAAGAARRRGARAGVLHPLCPVPDPAPACGSLPGTLACIDGEPRALRLLETLALRARLVPFRDPGFDRALYHAAAALAANGLVALFSSASEALARSASRPLSRELADGVVASLMQTSLRLCLERGYGRGALGTGPARGTRASSRTTSRPSARALRTSCRCIGRCRSGPCGSPASRRPVTPACTTRSRPSTRVLASHEGPRGRRVARGGPRLVEVVASSMPRGLAEAQALFRRAALLGADWHELRLDLWPAHEDVGALVAKATLPVLVTCRMPRDGGAFGGSVEERRLLVEKALGAGARGIDLEQWERWSPTPRGSLKRVVRSCHLQDSSPVDLVALRDELLALGGHIAKIVVPLEDLSEAGPVVDLLSGTDQSDPADGRLRARSGRDDDAPARLHARRPLVYASVAAGAETAPGQLPLDLVTGIYNVRGLSGSTLLFGVLGGSASASLGPWLHNRVFRWFGLDALYVPFETKDPVRLLPMLRRRLRGLSVTAPYKELMAKRCHQLEAAAQGLEAVNTVVFAAHGAMQAGTPTSSASRRRSCARACPSATRAGPRRCSAVGGAARAAVVALAELGFEVAVLARTPDRIREFCDARRVRLLALDAEALASVRPQVVVQATPVGSLGEASGEPRAGPAWTPEPGTYLLDMVYRPQETRLAADARAAGAIVVPGLEMFLAQAREQVRLFTDRRPGDDLLRRFLTGVV